MTNRREFLTWAGCAGLAGFADGIPPQTASPQSAATQGSDRSYWLGVLDRLSSPILENLSRRQLKREMPVEAANPAERARYTHLEAFGRLLAGLGPWLGLPELRGQEAEHQQRVLNSRSYRSMRPQIRILPTS